MSSKVKFLSRAKRKRLLEELSQVREGTPEAKVIREQLGAHAPVDPAVEAAKKKAAEDAAEARKAAQAEARKVAEAEARKAAQAEARKKREIAEAKKKVKVTPKKKPVVKKTTANKK